MDAEHEHVRAKEARGNPLSRNYIDAQQLYLNRHILPYFKDKKLAKISTHMIETWLLALKEKEGSSGKLLSPTTANHCLTTLKTMLKEATRQGTIPSNPAAFIEQLKERPKEKQIISIEEMRALFSDKTIDSIWAGDQRQLALNLLAASTGMRIGEIQALQIQHVHTDHVVVVHSWARKYGLKDPKWGSARQIPIPSRTSKCLLSLIEESPFQAPDDLVFWGKDGKSPMQHRQILLELYAAFDKIGISPAERRRRNITFHSWRHLFNSVCRAWIPDYTLRRLTGHRTQEMTELYTHLEIEDYKDVIKIQEEIIT